jgi:quinol monooxygenase YgiN
MPLTRQYVMIAAEGQEEAMQKALTKLAVKVRSLEGCEGVELYQDIATPSYFLFLECWASVEQHKQVGGQLGQEVLTAVMNAGAGPPEGRYLTPIAV